jgi:DNA-binding MarR family transcriptional regulator
MLESAKKAYVFSRIFTLANRLQMLGDKMDETITVKQWLLIAIVLKSPGTAPSLGEIASTAGYSRQNVKKMALILEKQDFVTLKQDEHDRRVLRVSLTDKCLEHFHNRAEMEEQFVDQLFKDLEDGLLDGLHRGLTRLMDNMAEMEKKL